MSASRSNPDARMLREVPGRVFVFGISGATWRLIDPLLTEGKLPTLAALIARGCRATLCSTRVAGDKHFRPQIAWPTIATGVEPDAHGVTRFYHTAADVRVPALWDRFSAAGRTVGLFGWPITWPVKPINGFIIPGYDGRDPSTFPPEYSFLRSLDRRQHAARRAGRATGSLQLAWNLVRGGVRPGTLARLARDAADMKLRAPRELRPLLARHARLDISTDIFLRLHRRHSPDFAAFVTFLVDYAEHRFRMFQEPRLFPDAPRGDIPPRLSSAVADAYVAVDRALGRILPSLHPHTVVAVLSEHGMADEPVSPEIGPWHYVLRPARVKELAGLDPATPAVPVARWIALRPSDVDDAAERLRSVRIEGTDLPLFQTYVHRGEVIVKLALNRATLEGREELESLQIRTRDDVFPFTWLAERFGRRRSAMHAEEGILVLAGPGIRHADIGRAKLTDVAPTLLRAAGMLDPARHAPASTGAPASGRLDGAVLEVFDPA